MIMNKIIVLYALYAAPGGNQQLSFAAANENIVPDNAVVDGPRRRLSKGGKGGKPDEPGRGIMLDHASGEQERLVVPVETTQTTAKIEWSLDNSSPKTITEPTHSSQASMADFSVYLNSHTGYDPCKDGEQSGAADDETRSRRGCSHRSSRSRIITPKPTHQPSSTPPPATCPLLGANPLVLQSIETICLIIPTGMSQPGTPVEAMNGIFCANTSNPYVLSITDVTDGNQKLLRANLDLASFTQNPGVGRKLEGEVLPPIVVEALTGVPAPSGDIAMITGGQAPEEIDFQGFWEEDCSFRVVSTQGGKLTGKLTGGTTFNIEFTQTGQVTSLLTTLGEDFDGAIGTIALDFAFAFKGKFAAN